MFFQARISVRIANQPSHCALYDACRLECTYRYGYDAVSFQLIVFNEVSNTVTCGKKRNPTIFLNRHLLSVHVYGNLCKHLKKGNILMEAHLRQRMDATNTIASQVPFECTRIMQRKIEKILPTI